MPTLFGREIGITGFGLMSLTPPVGKVPSRENAFASLNAALDTGANFWNGGQFYGTPTHNSLHLLRDYFTEYPENATRVVLSIKGGLTAQRVPDGSEAFVRQSVESALEILPPSLKTIDIFQCARVDPDTPIETTMRTLKKLKDEGKIGAVGLSEVKAETIKRANIIVPIAAVEVEFSLFENGILRNGVASTCAELAIPVICYSPLGRGLLTGKIMTQEDIPSDSMLRRLDRLQGDNLDQNLRLIQALHQLAAEYKPHSLSQLAISWIRNLSCRNGLPVLIPIAGSTKEENVRMNAIDVLLTEADLKKLDKVLEENKVVGDRAYAHVKKYMEG